MVPPATGAIKTGCRTAGDIFGIRDRPRGPANDLTSRPCHLPARSRSRVTVPMMAGNCRSVAWIRPGQIHTGFSDTLTARRPACRKTGISVFLRAICKNMVPRYHQRSLCLLKITHKQSYPPSVIHLVFWYNLNVKRAGTHRQAPLPPYRTACTACPATIEP